MEDAIYASPKGRRDQRNLRPRDTVHLDARCSCATALPVQATLPVYPFLPSSKFHWNTAIFRLRPLSRPRGFPPRLVPHAKEGKEQKVCSYFASSHFMCAAYMHAGTSPEGLVAVFHNFASRGIRVVGWWWGSHDMGRNDTE